VIGVIVKLLTGGLLDRVLGLYDSYIKKEISEAEFRSRVEIAAQDTEKAVEQAWADTAAKMAESVQQTVRVSPAIARAYASGMGMLFMALMWYLIGAPSFEVYTGTPWPYPQEPLGWAYALLMVMVGGGAWAVRK